MHSQSRALHAISQTCTAEPPSIETTIPQEAVGFSRGLVARQKLKKLRNADRQGMLPNAAAVEAAEALLHPPTQAPPPTADRDHIVCSEFRHFLANQSH